MNNHNHKNDNKKSNNPNSISNEFLQWKEHYHQFIEKEGERKSKFVTDSGIEIDPLFTPLDIDYLEHLNFSGQFPYTRGVQPNMYRGRFWTMRQYAGFGTARQSNERYRYLLSQGTTGLSVAFDLPTQMGYDSDESISDGEVGKVGVAISSLEDMEILFDHIPLEKISTSMTINATGFILLAMYIAVAKKRNIPIKLLRGTIQNDILKEYIARGTYIYPPAPSLRIITDTFEYCSQHLPNWNPISISGYHIREAGSSAVQEVAFTLANGITYVQAAIDRGLSVDSFAPRLSFFFNVHNNFFEEIAKFRAARKLWAHIMKYHFQAQDPKSQLLRFHTQTAGSTLQASQIDNNIIRVTLQALAAVLGGTQSLHTNGKDEALGLPTENTAQLALRTQQVIAYESGVTDTVDPLGGSYFVEQMTIAIEEKAKEYLKKIQDKGGMIACIENGYIKKEIEDAAYKYQKDIEKKEKIIVGVNEFVADNNENFHALKIDTSSENDQIQRVKSFKQKRQAHLLQQSLYHLKKLAHTKENLMPAVITCVENGATIGEISNTLRDVFGIYHESL